MKKAVIRSAVIIGIAVLSVIFGIVFQNLTDKAERKNYPLEYKKFVEKYSAEYGVPENVIFAVIKCQSDFDSSLLSDEGEIGLMMVSPYTLEEYKEELHDSYDTGMLYDPETNIKYGTYKLSKIYLKVGTWRAVYAAMSAGEDTVLGWLEDDRYSEKSELAKTKLTVIPDKEAELFTKRLEETAEKYKTLYYED